MQGEKPELQFPEAVPVLSKKNPPGIAEGIQFIFCLMIPVTPAPGLRMAIATAVVLLV